MTTLFGGATHQCPRCGMSVKLSDGEPPQCITCGVPLEPLAAKEAPPAAKDAAQRS